MLNQAAPSTGVTTDTIVHSNGKIHWLGVVLTGLVVVYVVVQTVESWKNIKKMKAVDDDFERRLTDLESKFTGPQQSSRPF